ncbi:sulfurtransferase [Lacinutrix iliipiscaria]|uniref:Sulfurtransferase n=1 Tax=Lacinutrix iliipiscaria TaxID=1230532 RepID=A0ABW5WQI4_9FLAO
MSELILEESIVSVSWLKAHLNASNLVILDATIPKVTHTSSLDTEAFQFPKARFFDIKKKFSDPDGPFPNTCPSEAQFTREAQNIGINKNSAIVVYDDNGIYSSARAWWLFKAFGHDNVAVLNGGLPEWKQAHFPLEKKHPINYSTGNFIAKYQEGYLLFFNDIQVLKNNSKYKILDARSANRFHGLAPEPREGLRSGTIPHSKNLPFENLLSDYRLLSKEHLEQKFATITDQKEQLIFSCGSGITACVLALGADVIGYKNIAVYDGSWTEYGSLITNENTMHWTKDELIAYTLLYAANSNFIEDNKEKNVIIERVDMQTFQNIHDEFDADNDYQSIQKIVQGVKDHQFNTNDINALLAEIKMLFFADGEFDVTERIMYRSLKHILEQ